jgi:hypothetical protein
MFQPMGSMSELHFADQQQSESCGSCLLSRPNSTRSTSLFHRAEGTMYRRGIDTTIKDTKGISILYSAIGAGKHFTIARQQGQSDDDSNQTQDRRLWQSFGPRLVYV